MTATYHPSAVLWDPEKGPEAFLDLKGVQEKARQLCRTACFPGPGEPIEREKPSYHVFGTKVFLLCYRLHTFSGLLSR